MSNNQSQQHSDDDDDNQNALNDALSRITASLVAQTLSEDNENVSQQNAGGKQLNSSTDVSIPLNEADDALTVDENDDHSNATENDNQLMEQDNNDQESGHSEHQQDDNEGGDDYNDVINNLVGNIFNDIVSTTENTDENEPVHNQRENPEVQDTKHESQQVVAMEAKEDSQSNDKESKKIIQQSFDGLSVSNITKPDDKDLRSTKNDDKPNEVVANTYQSEGFTEDELGVLGMEDAISKIVSETVQQISTAATQTDSTPLVSQVAEDSESISSFYDNVAESNKFDRSVENSQSIESVSKSVSQSEGDSHSAAHEPVELNVDDVIAQAVRNTIEATAQMSQQGPTDNYTELQGSQTPYSESVDVGSQVVISSSQKTVAGDLRQTDDASQSDLLISGAVHEIIKQAVQQSSASASPSTTGNNTLADSSGNVDVHANDDEYEDDFNIAQVVSNVVGSLQHLNDEGSDDNNQASSSNFNSDTTIDTMLSDISSEQSHAGSSQMLADAAIAQIVQNVVSAVSDASNKKAKKASRKTTKRQTSTTRTKKPSTSSTPQRKTYPSIPLIGVTRPSAVTSTAVNTSQSMLPPHSSQRSSNDVDEFQAAMDEMIRSVADAIISDNRRSATPTTVATAQQLNKQQAERLQKEQQKKSQEEAEMRKKKKQEVLKNGKSKEQQHESKKKSREHTKQLKLQQKESSDHDKLASTEEEKRKKKEIRQLEKHQEKARLKEARKLAKQKEKAKKVTTKKSVSQVSTNLTSTPDVDNLQSAIDEVVSNVIGKTFTNLSTEEQAVISKAQSAATAANKAKGKQSVSEATGFTRIQISSPSSLTSRKGSKKKKQIVIDPEILKKREASRLEKQKRDKAREMKKEELKKKQLEKAALKAQKEARALEIAKAKEEKRKQFEEAKKKQEETREKARLEKEKMLQEKAKIKEAREKSKQEKLQRKEERRKKREEKEKLKAEKQKLKELKLKEKEEALKKKEERKKIEEEKARRREERRKKREEQLKVKQEKIKLREERIKLKEEKSKRKEERKMLKQAKLERKKERIRLRQEKEMKKLEKAKMREEKARLKEDKIKRREQRRQKKLQNEQLEKDKQLRRALGTSYVSPRISKSGIYDSSSDSTRFNRIVSSNSESIRSVIESAISTSDSSSLTLSKKHSNKSSSRKHSKKSNKSKSLNQMDTVTLSAEQKHTKAMTALANEYASTPYLRDLLTKHLANNSFAAGLDLNVLSSRIATGLSKFREYMNNGSLAADLSAQSGRKNSSTNSNKDENFDHSSSNESSNNKVTLNRDSGKTNSTIQQPNILTPNTNNITEVIANIKKRAAASIASQENLSTSSSETTSSHTFPGTSFLVSDTLKQASLDSNGNSAPRFSSAISSIVDRIILKDETADSDKGNFAIGQSHTDSTVDYARKYISRPSLYEDSYDVDMVRKLKRKLPSDVVVNAAKRPSIKRVKYNDSGESIYDNSDYDNSDREKSLDEAKTKFHIPKLRSIGSYENRLSVVKKPVNINSRLSAKISSNSNDGTSNGLRTTAKPGIKPSLATVFAINSGRSSNTGFGKLKMKNRSESDKSNRKVDILRRPSYRSTPYTKL